MHTRVHVYAVIAELKSEASNRGARVAVSLYIYLYMYVCMYICSSQLVTPQLCKSHRSWNPLFVKPS